MGPLTTGPRRGGCCIVLASALLAGGCTESLEGYEGTVSSGSNVSVRIVAGRPDSVTFTASRPAADAEGHPRHVRPYDTILKVPGYLPALPESVSESPDGYGITMRLPADLVKAMRGSPLGHHSIRAELILPVETAVTSYLGVEHYLPGTTYHSVELQPVYVGPLSRLAEGVRGWLRGLYAAR